MIMILATPVLIRKKRREGGTLCWAHAAKALSILIPMIEAVNSNLIWHLV